MTSINAITLDVDDVAAAEKFYAAAFDGSVPVSVRAAEDGGSGFRAFTLSLVCAQPGNADAFVEALTRAGATVLKPAAKSFWGYGGVVQAPDGTIWKVACQKKKDSAPVRMEYDEFVILLGCADVKATKQFYADRGFEIGKAYGGKYVELVGQDGIKMALYPRKALAKDASVDPEGEGSHRVLLGATDGTAFTDPDGFQWGLPRADP